MQGVSWRCAFGLHKQTENLNFSLRVRQKSGKWARPVTRVCPPFEDLRLCLTHLTAVMVETPEIRCVMVLCLPLEESQDEDHGHPHGCGHSRSAYLTYVRSVTRVDDVVSLPVSTYAHKAPFACLGTWLLQQGGAWDLIHAAELCPGAFPALVQAESPCLVRGHALRGSVSSTATRWW